MIRNLLMYNILHFKYTSFIVQSKIRIWRNAHVIHLYDIISNLVIILIKKESIVS